MRRSEPLRVLQIIGISAGGGVESVIMNYYRHIDRSRVQFDFVIHADSPVDITAEVEALGGRVYKVTSYTKNIFAFVWEIYCIIRAGYYDIIHSNMNTLSVFPLFAACLAGAKIRILHNHSTTSPAETKRNILKLLLRPWSKFLATEYWACSRLAGTWMYGEEAMKRKEVTVINNAIDLNAYAFDRAKRHRLRSKLGADENTFIVGHVGRFVFVKNHSFLLNAFAEAKKTVPNLKLLLIGDGPLLNAVKESTHERELSGDVSFLGLRSDVSDWYNAMDLFVLPSYYEGLPVVGIEAQANGLPMLVSDHVTKEMKATGLVEYVSIEEGEALWAEHIAVSAKRKNTHQSTTEAMRAAGFDIEEEAQKLVERYERLAGRRQM